MNAVLEWCLHRHASGDWGELSPDDLAANQHALIHQTRLFSGYDLVAGRLWIITESTRAYTTLLLPWEY